MSPAALASSGARAQTRGMRGRRRRALLALVGMFGCSGEAAPPPIDPPAAPAPEPEPEEPAPVERELRYVEDPWPSEIDGFDIRRRYDAAEFERVCRAARGTFEHRDAGERCHLGRPPGRTIEYETLQSRGDTVCAWDVRERVPIAEATDARIGAYFEEMLAFQRTLVEHGVPPAAAGRPSHPHIRADRDLDDACWPRLVAGDFECVRAGDVTPRIETSTGTLRYREIEGRPETREILHDDTEAIGIDVYRDAVEPVVGLVRRRIVRCAE